MSQRILDEREYRRGLVLGLTLAEILILLLFLLLLALGVRLNKLEQEKVRVENEIKVVLDAIKPHLPKGQGHLDERSAKALISKLHLVAQIEQEFPALEGRFDLVLDLVHAGVNAIDRDAPPVALKEARDILRTIGAGSRLAQITALEKKVAELEARLTGRNVEPKKGPASGQLTLAGRTIEILKRIEPLLANVQDGGIMTGSVPGKKGAHDWPPIITLSEASGYSFATGSADVTSDFQDNLSTKVVRDLLRTIGQYGVDVIEVVGHTDEQPYNARPPRLEPPPSDSSPSTFLPRRSLRVSNLDTSLIPFLKGDAEKLVAADNAGLGLARAVSVALILAKDPRLAKVRILPLSGGQLILVGDKLSPGSPGDAKERRRIEIRARRSGKSAER